MPRFISTFTEISILFFFLLFPLMSIAQFGPSLELEKLNGSNGFALNGVSAGERSGAAVASIGDINNDGIGDLIVGAPGADTDEIDSGNSYIIFGKKNLIFSDSFE